jgi:hypothetical protein
MTKKIAKPAKKVKAAKKLPSLAVVGATGECLWRDSLDCICS